MNVQQLVTTITPIVKAEFPTATIEAQGNQARVQIIVGELGKGGRALSFIVPPDVYAADPSFLTSLIARTKSAL